MPIVPMKVILDSAEKLDYGVPALNINEMLQLQAYLNAAYELRSPLILQASMGSREFTGWLANIKPDTDLGAKVTIGMIWEFVEAYKASYGYEIPVAVILDHGPDISSCIGAIKNGFSAVMIDGSLDYSMKVKGKDGKEKHPPHNLKQNISLSRKVVDFAHQYGVSVEGELGTLGGIEDATSATEVLLTDPKEVQSFVEQTGVDALAVAIGTSHGAYKFKTAPKLALDLLPEIRKNAGSARLVLHGASSVPPWLPDKINHYPVMHLRGSESSNDAIEIRGRFYAGREDAKGKPVFEDVKRTYLLGSPEQMASLGNDLMRFSCMKPSAGVPIEQIKQAIRRGVRKINVDTDGRLATTAALRAFMAENPDVFDQRKYFEKAREALYHIAVSKISDFGSVGHAGDVEIITLDEMAKRYESSKS